MNHALSLTREQLGATYRSYGKPREQWRIGGEFERVVLRSDGGVVRYDDADGIAALLVRAAALSGGVLKFEGKNPVEVKLDAAALTLEPGAQVELSGAPYRRLADLAAEVRRDRALLHTVLAELDHGRGGLHLCSPGLTPYTPIAQIPFVPKGRYAVMQAYLPDQGPLAHWMMKGTCSVQVNFDYADEADCAAKFYVAASLAPLSVAMFANSPIAEGKDTGYASYRAHIWTQTDAARTGYPESIQGGYRHDAWVDYLLDRPMMFYMRHGAWAPAGGVTFARWAREGIDGVFPTLADWELHQTSVFTEVRVKRTIELRSADSVSAELGIAFCALWTGVLYGALDACRALADEMVSAESRGEQHLAAARSGLQATFVGRPAADWARELVEIGARGLEAIGEDVSLLAPLQALVAAGHAPSVAVREAFQRDPSPRNLLPLIAW